MRQKNLNISLFDNLNQEPILLNKRFYFFKKENRSIVPVEDININEKAKNKLNSIVKSYKKISIPSRFRKDWKNVSLYHPTGDIEKANSILIDANDGAYSLDNKLNDLTGKEWTKFTKSWFIFDALHSDLKEEKEITRKANLNSEDHPATYSPTMLSNFISFFTKENQIVLDPFCGIGSTLVACDRTKRKGIGIELNPKYVQITRLRTNQLVIHDDSSKVKKLLEKRKINSIDFSISSPPYWDILNRSTGSFEKIRNNKNLDIKYSDDKLNDLGNIHDYELFLEKLSDIYFQIYDFLRNQKYLVVIIKNIKKSGKHYSLAWDLAKILSKKYVLKDEKIWCQDKTGLSPFGYPFAWTSNIVHHYCLIFQKNELGEKKN